MTAQLLDVVGVAVEDLQERHGLLRLGQLARHLVRRHQGHQGVIALVIVAAEGAGIRQGRGGDQPAEVFAGLDLVDDGRKQPVDRGVLHECNQRLDRAERQTAGGVIRQGAGGQPKILGDDRAHAGEQHAPAHIREKLTTVTAIHGRSPLGLVEKVTREGDNGPPGLVRASVDYVGTPSPINVTVLHDFSSLRGRPHESAVAGRVDDSTWTTFRVNCSREPSGDRRRIPRGFRSVAGLRDHRPIGKRHTA